MENAQKAIMIGVGLFITIIIIAAVMLITGMGQNLLNKGSNQVNGISESLMNDLTQQYADKTMAGSQAKSAAVQLVNRDDEAIVVKIGDTPVETTAEVNSNITSNTQKYKSTVTSNSNAGTVEIKFEPLS